MEFRTSVHIEDSNFKLNHNKKSLLLGSCFTDNVGKKLKYYKFPSIINPFGVLYNPISVKNALEILMGEKSLEKEDLIKHNNNWISFYHGTGFSGPEKDIVFRYIKESVKESSDWLMDSDLLTITFGTSWAYRLKENGMVVANCHKLPAKNFERIFLRSDYIVDNYTELIKDIYQFNPKIKIVFTISPVRHLKDGLIENQKSKSNLVMSVHKLLDRFPEIEYFPSYEIMMDELRDYRFFAEDMTHIGSTGINYIWERFAETYIKKSSFKLMEKVEKIQKAKEHKPFRPESIEYHNFLKKQIEKVQQLKDKHPSLNLDEELDFFTKRLESRNI
jgi:hypothetical protein